MRKIVEPSRVDAAKSRPDKFVLFFDSTTLQYRMLSCSDGSSSSTAMIMIIGTVLYSTVQYRPETEMRSDLSGLVWSGLDRSRADPVRVANRGKFKSW
ncbi:hypothetical protein VTL71DRAFT_6458 [Oculimacula yallundae]|uniref:Uncharacterized protein n=1 Tax=Oculimacula yallundae TaxID=86028 RepID=A0ABR4BXX6_9HELO